jgi:4'-phosphopantetheinyl transferase EntD
LSSEPAGLMADEALSVAHAVPRRRLEFAMGRECARRAMATLGHAKVSLPRGQDRTPAWPSDLVGSITHTDSWAAAAVGRREDGFVAVGIDLELANELAADLWAPICTPEEQANLTVVGGLSPGLAARVLFCLKEAAFKCQFPLSGAMLEFADITIEADVEAGMFRATFQKAAAPFRADDRLVGRFAISGDHIASAVVVTSQCAP